MSLEALGNIGDFVGGVAVVVTLVYLALQIRQNTHQVRQSVELARAAAVKAANATEPSLLAIAQDPELARIVREGLTDYSSLQGDDKLRFTMILGALISSMATGVTEQSMLGLHQGEFVGDQAISLRTFLATPGGREWWKRQGAQYSTSFQDFVNEEVLVQSGAPHAD